MAEPQKSAASGNGGKITSPEMDREIERLKKDMAQISDHVSRLLSATRTTATRRARYQVDRPSRPSATRSTMRVSSARKPPTQCVR